MRVVGIDPSLSRTGVAYITEDPLSARVYCLPTQGSRAASVVDRARRLEHIVQWAVHGASEADEALLVAIEGPAFGTPGGSTWDRAGLWWSIVSRLVRREVPVAVVAPTTRAKWATGNGAASKAEVVEAVRALWPGVKVRNDDEADALAMATMAAQRIGFDVPELPHHRACLEPVEWPEGVDEALEFELAV